MFYTIEDGNENCLYKTKNLLLAYIYYYANKNAKEIFKFLETDFEESDLIGCIANKNEKGN